MPFPDGDFGVIPYGILYEIITDVTLFNTGKLSSYRPLYMCLFLNPSSLEYGTYDSFKQTSEAAGLPVFV